MRTFMVITNRGQKFCGKAEDVENCITLTNAIEFQEIMTNKGPVAVPFNLGIVYFKDMSESIVIELQTDSPYYEEYIKTTTDLVTESKLVC